MLKLKWKKHCLPEANIQPNQISIPAENQLKEKIPPHSKFPPKSILHHLALNYIPRSPRRWRSAAPPTMRPPSPASLPAPLPPQSPSTGSWWHCCRRNSPTRRTARARRGREGISSPSRWGIGGATRPPRTPWRIITSRPHLQHHPHPVSKVLIFIPLIFNDGGIGDKVDQVQILVSASSSL